MLFGHEDHADHTVAPAKPSRLERWFTVLCIGIVVGILIVSFGRSW